MALDYGTGGVASVRMAGPFAVVGGGVGAKLAEVTLPISNWKGGESPFSQVVTIEEVSVNSMINLLPTPEQLDMLREKNVVFCVENDGGTVTVYAIGDKPDVSYTFQVMVMEVVA